MHPLTQRSSRSWHHFYHLGIFQVIIDLLWATVSCFYLCIHRFTLEFLSASYSEFYCEFCNKSNLQEWTLKPRIRWSKWSWFEFLMMFYGHNLQVARAVVFIFNGYSWVEPNILVIGSIFRCKLQETNLWKSLKDGSCIFLIIPRIHNLQVDGFSFP